MPKTDFPRDRFDEVSDDVGRVGAHRAENPRMRGGVVLLWAVLTTVVLIVAGIFGTLLISGRISFEPEPAPTAAPAGPVVEPVIDTSFSVVVLNATPQQGLATQVKETIVAAGWPDDSVFPSQAASTGFPTTTVYYALPEYEAAAAGLAEAIGGAEIALDARYQPVDDPGARQLNVVIGLDRVADVGEAPAS